MPKTRKKLKKSRLWEEVLVALKDFAEALERQNKTPCRKPRIIKRGRKS